MELVLACRPVPHYVVRKFRCLENKGTSLWNFVPNSWLRNIPTASRSRCQQNSSTVESVGDTYTTVDESWLFTTSRSAVTLYLHYLDLLWICCTTCFYSCAAVDKILTDIALRAVRLRQQSLMVYYQGMPVNANVNVRECYRILTSYKRVDYAANNTGAKCELGYAKPVLTCLHSAVKLLLRVARSPAFDRTVRVFGTGSGWQFHSKPDRWKSGSLSGIYSNVAQVTQRRSI